jgi:hypothetical protein
VTEERYQNAESVKANSGQDDAVRVAQAAAVAGSLYFLLHCMWVILGPETRVMAWLYDDSFYYLITAKHFSEQHIASFDGVTVTSGYHPLWMWLCAAVYSLRGRLDLTYVRLCMGVAVCLSSGVLFTSVRHAAMRRKVGLLWTLALGATSYSALNNGLTVMEWPLVILCWALLHWLLISHATAKERRNNRTVYGAAFALGFAGSLSRTDFGLIPACYLVGGIVVALRYRDWGSARRAAAAVMGAVVGLAMVFIYNHQMTGSWLQQSAQVKRVFATVSEPFNPIPPLWQFARVLLYLPPLDLDPRSKAMMLRWGVRVLLIACVAVAAMLVMAWRVSRKSWMPTWGRSQGDDLALSSAVLGVAGFLLVYCLNSQATYGWYTATVTGFIFVLATRALGSIRGRTAAWIVLILIALNLWMAAYSRGNARAQWQENVIGMRMRAEHPGARMGGGDVGKPSFYNNGTMFNLDGLMNNEVVPYLVAGKIHCYVLRRHIEYMSDIGSITVPLTDAERARRNEPPLPWSRYFTPTGASDEAGQNNGYNGYLKADFDAIRNSGECGTEEQQNR